jgi:FHA domain
MKPFAIELDDRAVSFARDGHVLSSAPSSVWDGSTGERAGANAWDGLRLHPTAASTRHLGLLLSQPVATDRAIALVAAELLRRLTAQAPAADERVWIAAPARATADGLGAMLAIARYLSLPVDGFVDSAVATAAALGLERSAIVLELGLYHAAATSIDRDGGQIRRRRTALTERGGLMAFYQSWLELVSTTMVKQTRFDPLHDAATEQRLFDSLPAWARAVAVDGSTRAALTKGAERFEVALTRDQFVQVGQPIHREILRLVQELRPAGAPVALVVPAMMVHLPGLRDELEQLVGCELVSVPDGFAAAATSLLDLPGRATDDPVRLLRRLPSSEQGALCEAVSRELLGSSRSRSAPPSHLLLEGQVYSLGGDALVIGRSPAGGARAITLSDGLAGVGRRHCTFTRDGDELVLLDHSSFGTFVNGERVAERVRVRAGDRVRLGDPGVELALLAVDEVPTVAN